MLCLSGTEAFPVEFAPCQIWCIPYGHVWSLAAPPCDQILVVQGAWFQLSSVYAQNLSCLQPKACTLSHTIRPPCPFELGNYF